MLRTCMYYIIVIYVYIYIYKSRSGGDGHALESDTGPQTGCMVLMLKYGY